MPTEIDGLVKWFEKMPDAVLEAERAAINDVGKELQNIVRQQVTTSGINDAHGKVRTWQELHKGSKGLYAAVRPTAGSTGKDSPGAITNYLESGHKVHNSTKRARSFKFYAATASKLNELTNKAKRIAEEGIQKYLNTAGE